MVLFWQMIQNAYYGKYDSGQWIFKNEDAGDMYYDNDDLCFKWLNNDEPVTACKDEFYYEEINEISE